ncbi:cytochrome P450 [Streptomyces sp. NPDC004296]|uniref:cytochrome P450 family protein n=1 Tax=Streptomyces sp. NPDC004296 TaxID=3364697 RepID=UPI0036B1E31C
MTASLDQHRTPIDPSGRNSRAEFARLRRRGDLVPVELPGLIPAWAPTRHSVLKALLTDPKISKDPQHWGAWRSGWIQQHPEAHWISAWITVRSMLSASGPDHTRLRKLVAPAFSPRRIQALRPGVERISTALLDRLAALPPRETTDLRAAFAHPLPMEVIGDLYGLTSGERADVAAFAATIMRTSAVQDTAIRALETARTALTALVARKQASPGDDLTTALIAARDGHDHLTGDELVDTLVLILVAGHETTVNLITNAAVALLQHPDQLTLAREGSVPWASVVDETLRWAGSITSLPLRFATADIPIAGQIIRKGEAILATFGGVGWDPAQHGESAAAFDIRRRQGSHLAFGHGVHYCLGAPLARMEAEVALPALFDRFPDIALADAADLEPLPSLITNGYSSVQVVLRAPAPAFPKPRGVPSPSCFATPHAPTLENSP